MARKEPDSATSGQLNWFGRMLENYGEMPAVASGVGGAIIGGLIGLGIAIDDNFKHGFIWISILLGFIGFWIGFGIVAIPLLILAETLGKRRRSKS